MYEYKDEVYKVKNAKNKMNKNIKNKINLFLFTMALVFCLPITSVKTLANITENNLPGYSNVIASGVQMEAYSVEDNGAGVSFNIIVHNDKIDYLASDAAKGNKKINQYIENGTYSQTIFQSKVKKKSYGFKIGCKAPGRIRYKKLSGSSQLSITTKGKVTVKKGTPAGTYKMKVQISAGAYSIYKAKTIKKTIKVVVKADKSEKSDEDSDSGASGSYKYIVNTNTGKFHYPTCYSVSKMSEKNKEYSTKSRDELISSGYSPCGNCKP